MSMFYAMVVRSCMVNPESISEPYNVLKVEIKTEYKFITTNKNLATGNYNTFINTNFFDTTKGYSIPKAEVYLGGFSSASDVGKKLSSISSFVEELTNSDSSLTEERERELQQKINGILSPVDFILSISKADEKFNFETEGIKALTKAACDWCGAEFNNLLHGNNTVFKNTLCDKCWETYLGTPFGMIECIFGIISCKYRINDFSDMELATMKKAWQEYRYILSYYLYDAYPDDDPDETLRAIEATALKFGLQLSEFV